MIDKYHLISHFLHWLPPELAHNVAIQLLRYFPVKNQIADLDLHPFSQDRMGIHFPHPIGLAAGFDKQGDVFHKLGQLGFSFLEIGSVTPKPQAGNPRPRLFRLPEQQAIINRYGFNSKGLNYMLNKLTTLKRTCITGINLGKNKQTIHDIDDFILGVNMLGDQADYLTLNISSPNTPGLRDLQNPLILQPLLKEVNRILRQKKRNIPLLVKLSPDMPLQEERRLVEFLVEQGIGGIIVSNSLFVEQGGLSGEPLKAKSTEMLKRVHLITEGKIPLIGCGGIASGQDAFEKLLAGAHLLQIYTAFVYQGPAIISRILKELNALFCEKGITHIQEITGRYST